MVWHSGQIVCSMHIRDRQRLEWIPRVAVITPLSVQTTSRWLASPGGEAHLARVIPAIRDCWPSFHFEITLIAQNAFAEVLWAYPPQLPQR